MNLDEKKKLRDQLIFIHQRMTQTSQYMISEFEIAKDSIKMLTDMANKVIAEVEEMEGTIEQEAK